MRNGKLGLVLAATAFGQAGTGTHSASGNVRNSVTGEPVGNALVILERVPGPHRPGEPDVPDQELPQSKATITGAGGEFHFYGLPAGLYTCRARRPDFIPEDENAGTFEVPRQASEGLIQLKLTPFGSIQGRVVNQYGEPLENVAVHIFSISTWEGERIPSEAGLVWTDDLGQFLMTRLPPAT